MLSIQAIYGVACLVLRRRNDLHIAKSNRHLSLSSQLWFGYTNAAVNAYTHVTVKIDCITATRKRNDDCLRCHSEHDIVLWPYAL